VCECNDRSKSRLISYCAKLFKSKIAFVSELKVLHHLSQIKTSNIVEIVDSGIISFNGVQVGTAEIPFIIFERCDRDVCSFIQSNEGFSEKHAAKIMTDLLDGLTELSNLGVIHRFHCFIMFKYLHFSVYFVTET
jgi:serine/threonine protein kinase